MTGRARAAAVATAALAWALAACSAPAPLPELAAAERHEHAGRDDAALAAYAEATTTCRAEADKARRRERCAAAHTGRAETLERLGRRAEAAAAYEDLPAALPDAPEVAARSLYRAGRLRLELDEDEHAYRLLWKVVTDYPDELSADFALRLVTRDGRRRDPAQLYQVLGELAAALAETAVVDNLLYAMAELAEADLGDPAAALALLDRIARDHQDGGLRDDALWHGARLARAGGDGRGAARRLRALLATREVAFMVGSYFSVWLDDAQLELGRVLRDDLADGGAALAAFRQLARDYPRSVLHDDAAWEIALTHERLGRADRACAALAELERTWPDSKHELERAPALRVRLGCK